MDKYEYKIRAEEIRDLISKKKYAEAMKIADMIDWRRVKNVNMLCTVSDLYKINRKYEESREILQLAYEKHPGGRMILYSLCELSIKLDDVVQAVEYYKEFVQTAPRDNGRYVLQYKLYEAQEVTLEERIAVLEELKRREYREKWAYELAYLYHRIGLGTKCVEECDELILWFGEGKYVTKAMELKMLHAPLTPEQEKKYRSVKGDAAPLTPPEEIIDDELDIHVKPVNVGEYATINLQKELAESMRAVLGDEGPVEEDADPTVEYQTVGAISDTDEFRNFEEMEMDELESYEEEYQAADPSEIGGPGEFTREILANMMQDQDTEEEEEAAPRQEAAQPENEAHEPSVRSVVAKAQEREGIPDEQEIFFEDADTVRLPSIEEEAKVVKLSTTGEIPKIVDSTGEIPKLLKKTAETLQNMKEQEKALDEKGEKKETPPISRVPAEGADTPVPMPSAESMAREKNKNFDNLLTQEYDGQIGFAVPHKETVEKQITGQMSIEDILDEWEQMKKENEEQRAEAVRKRVQEQTGEIFTQFDASTKQGPLGELSKTEESAKEPAAEEKERQEREEIPVSEKEADNGENEAVGRVKEEEIKEAKEAAGTATAAETEKAAEEAAETETAAEAGKAAKAAAETETAERKGEDAQKEGEKEEKAEKAQRAMTPEEKRLFGAFIQTKSTKNQILDTIDHISLASYTGNVILTGEPGMDSIKLAKNIIKDVQMNDSNFSGRMAKITGQALNNKDLEKTFENLKNGALIVESAGKLKDDTVQKMTKLLEQEEQGIIVILEDSKINMNRFLENHKILHQNFNLRIDIEALENHSLVAFGRRYALEKEYTIDDLGVLALYTRIEEMQTSEHSVTTKEVKEIVDDAIDHANKKNIPHFMDIVLGKRYDEEDMIVLREKDFV